MLAWRAAAAGARVDLFDSDPAGGCSAAAAGMLGVSAEAARAGHPVGELGARSLALWRRWLEEIGLAGALVERGAILAALGRDLPELDRVARQIGGSLPDGIAPPRRLAAAELAGLEPDLAHLPRAWLLPADAHLDAERVLAALRAAGREAGVSWHEGEAVDSLEPGRLVAAGRSYEYDWSCDCRGMGSGGRLRPVRGEIVHLHSDEVNISRPVRLVHPRQPIYVVPRPPGRYLVGATEIESADAGPLSLRSALELLSAAYALQPAFAEARIVDMRTGRRPAYPDNVPRLDAQQGLICINGMYRHGYMAGPALVDRRPASWGWSSERDRREPQRRGAGRRQRPGAQRSAQGMGIRAGHAAGGCSRRTAGAQGRAGAAAACSRQPGRRLLLRQGG